MFKVAWKVNNEGQRKSSVTILRNIENILIIGQKINFSLLAYTGEKNKKKYPYYSTK